jgi:transposase
MMPMKKSNLSPKFRLEAVQLVVYNGHTYEGAAKVMGVGYSIISKWVK